MKTIAAMLIVISGIGLSIPAYAVGPGDDGIKVAQVQQLLQGFGYTVNVDGHYGPQTEKAVRSWQKSNGLTVDGIAGPATLASLLSVARLNSATPAAPAISPSGLRGLPFAPTGLDNCAEMKFYRQQAGLPDRFDSLGWRESNCRNEDGVHTGCCYGYWQLHKDHVRSGYAKRWRDECGITSLQDFNSDTPLDKQRQACGAFVLYSMSGYTPWGG
jgi:hypothetical protein